MQQGGKSRRCILHYAAGSKIFPLHCDSLLHLAVGSQILPLHLVVGSQILPLHDAMGSQILPLHDAAGSQILPPHDAAGSQFGSRESSKKNFGGHSGLLKGQSCKNSHLGDYNLLYT
jgi:hypothetical protein